MTGYTTVLFSLFSLAKSKIATAASQLWLQPILGCLAVYLLIDLGSASIGRHIFLILVHCP